MYPVGARVRFLHLACKGTIIGLPKRSELTGEPRLPVLWDETRTVAWWHPKFLVPADRPIALDPELVAQEHLIFFRPRIALAG